MDHDDDTDEETAETPLGILKRKKDYFKTIIIPVLLHGYISI